MIGSLSRTIQQYSPPREWITCELGVFPIFWENDLSKVDKFPGLTFLKERRDFEGFKTAFSSIYLKFLLDGMLTTPVYSHRRGRFVNSAFPNKKKTLHKNGSLFMTNKNESKCLLNFYVSSEYDKECYRKTTPHLEEPSRLTRLHAQNGTTNNKLSELTENNKAPFSSQVRKQFKLYTVPFNTITLLFAKW